MYLTHPTERRNAFNNFPLHLCQQRHPFSKSRARLLKKKGRLPILAKAKGTLPGTAFSRHNVYTSYPPSFAARRWIQILALFTSLSNFLWNNLLLAVLLPASPEMLSTASAVQAELFLSSLYTLLHLSFESALNENSLDSSRHVTPRHFFMHFLKMFRFCSPVSQPNRTTVSLQYKVWKHATASQLPFAGRLLIWEHCTDLQFIFLTVPLMLNQ